MSESLSALSSSSSSSLAALAPALAKAQAKIQGASKDKTNPAFKSKYADLASVWDACREALTSNGLSVVQLPMDAEGARVALRTVLLHSSGEFVSTTVSAPLGKNDAQAVGSALTYLRRYSLSAMVGIAPDEDDDGNAASGKGYQEQRNTDRRTEERREPIQRAHDPSFTDAERKRFCASLPEVGPEFTYDTLASFCEAIDRPRPSAMTQSQRLALFDALKNNTNGVADRYRRFASETGGK